MSAGLHAPGGGGGGGGGGTAARLLGVAVAQLGGAAPFVGGAFALFFVRGCVRLMPPRWMWLPWLVEAAAGLAGFLASMAFFVLGLHALGLIAAARALAVNRENRHLRRASEGADAVDTVRPPAHWAYAYPHARPLDICVSPRVPSGYARSPMPHPPPPAAARMDSRVTDLHIHAYSRVFMLIHAYSCCCAVCAQAATAALIDPGRARGTADAAAAAAAAGGDGGGGGARQRIAVI